MGRRHVVSMGLMLAGACLAADPAVTKVRAEQRQGTPYVDITYDLADSDTESLAVTVAVSTNGGAAFFTPVIGLSGDLGGVSRGSGKKIIWNAGATLPPALFNNVLARVTANDLGRTAVVAGTNSGTDPSSGSYSLTVGAFSMDATEVTKAQWDVVCKWAVANGYGFDSVGSGKGANHPVHSVSWYDCVKWCNARSQKEGKAPCYTVDGSVYKKGQSVPVCNFSANGYRLPTRDEWNYAARGGLRGRPFPWGYAIQHANANYWADPWLDFESSGYFGYEEEYTSQGYHPTYATGEEPYTSPVASFEANGYGLYDMAGNVDEWCWTTAGWGRLVRGGSWRSSSQWLGCGDMGAGYAPGGGGIDRGFRTLCL